MQPASLLHLIPTVLLAAVGIIVLARGRSGVLGTTLLVPWIAATVAVGCWGAVGLLAPFGSICSPALLSHLWYGVGVVVLCPAVAVLGARRPVDRPWPVFVLLPLAAVLAVPSLSTLWSHGLETPLRVETPMLVGFLLVLVMGSGNYVGTRYTLAALLYASAIGLIVLPSTVPGRTDWQSVLRTIGTLLFAGGLLSAFLSARRKPPDVPDYDRIWLAFRDAYGVVWAKRVLERVNWSAREEKWAAELTFTGLAWKADPTEDERRKTIERLNHTFEWLLKRFVSDDWIEKSRKVGESKV